MIEVFGNLWEYKADVRVITTNGTVKRNGECVMGRGCALEAKQQNPKLAKLLGTLIRDEGNHVHRLDDKFGGWDLAWEFYSFPVKHHWREVADVELIVRSAEELLCAVETGDLVVVMPRPGCGNGGLRWEDVKPVIEPILDDRFHVITFGGK